MKLWSGYLTGSQWTRRHVRLRILASFSNTRQWLHRWRSRDVWLTPYALVIRSFKLFVIILFSFSSSFSFCFCFCFCFSFCLSFSFSFSFSNSLTHYINHFSFPDADVLRCSFKAFFSRHPGHGLPSWSLYSSYSEWCIKKCIFTKLYYIENRTNNEEHTGAAVQQRYIRHHARLRELCNVDGSVLLGNSATPYFTSWFIEIRNPPDTVLRYTQKSTARS